MAERIRRHFDEAGELEWDRLAASARTRAGFEIHRRLLAGFVRPGQRVLEVGAGPGRFTIALAEMGARVVVTDVSEVQLELNRRHVAEAGAQEAVEQRLVLDVRDTGRFPDHDFDLVLAYGGPLSYVFEEAPAALAGLLRVAPLVVGSVMSALGAWRFFLPTMLEQEAEIGADAADCIIATGDLRHEGRSEGHTCQMYRWRELEALIQRAGGEVVSASSSNWASLGDEASVEALAADPVAWARFLAHEERACREPGLLDAGTHILFAARAR